VQRALLRVAERPQDVDEVEDPGDAEDGLDELAAERAAEADRPTVEADDADARACLPSVMPSR
jgi:hypothetical protein